MHSLFKADALSFEGMRTTGGSITSHEHGRFGFKKKNLHTKAHAGELVQSFVQLGGVLAPALIQTEGYSSRPFKCRVLQQPHHIGHKHGGHAIRGKQPHVLKYVQHSALSGSRKTDNKKNGLVASGEKLFGIGRISGVFPGGCLVWYRAHLFP